MVFADLDSLPKAFAVIEELWAVIGQLQARIDALEVENKRLRDQLHLNSHNSSLPPSSDTSRQPPSTRSLRQQSGRKPGGQAGHEGATLTQVDTPDVVVVHPVAVCAMCGQDLSDVPVTAVETRQVFELPPLKLLVTAHQADIKTCPHCAQETKGVFPVDVRQPVQYGPRVKGFLVYLNQEQLLPYERATLLCEDLLGQPVSQGTLLTANDTCYAHLASTEAAIKHNLQQAAVVHVDETGVYEQGKRIWLHSASTPEMTYYFPHEKRGKDAMQAAEVLPQFHGTAVHDHWESYQAFDQCAHAFCNAHHLRELQRAIDQDEAQWAHEMKTLLRHIKEQVDAAKAVGQLALPAEQIDVFQHHYRDIVEGALRPYRTEPAANAPPKRGRAKQSTTKNLLDRLDKYQTETLRFMTDFRVPFDNNLAERDIRMTKVKQKISGTFRSSNGTRYFCRIRGFISTLKKQGRNILEGLTQTFNTNQAV